MTRKDVVTGARVVNVTRVIDLVRAIGLVVVIITVSVARPQPGADSALGLAIAVALSLSAAAWIVWMLAERRPWMNLGSLIVMRAAGGVLAGLSPSSPAVAIGCAAVFIHDVLAHSLAAVSVNLQAAEGLLSASTLPADNPELAKVIECIDRAGTLTREGLAAARRAVLALRDDAAQLSDQLSSLATQYRAVGDLAVDFTVTGEPRPLSEAASLAAYRTAQEGLTNARKHAPGQPVALSLGFEAAQMTVTVANPLPPAGTAAPLTTAGAGDGLTGLGERAALAGGTLEAGPADGTWRVCLKMPT